MPPTAPGGPPPTFGRPSGGEAQFFKPPSAPATPAGRAGPSARPEPPNPFAQPTVEYPMAGGDPFTARTVKADNPFAPSAPSPVSAIVPNPHAPRPGGPAPSNPGGRAGGGAVPGFDPFADLEMTGVSHPPAGGGSPSAPKPITGIFDVSGVPGLGASAGPGGPAAGHGHVPTFNPTPTPPGPPPGARPPPPTFQVPTPQAAPRPSAPPRSGPPPGPPPQPQGFGFQPITSGGSGLKSSGFGQPFEFDDVSTADFDDAPLPAPVGGGGFDDAPLPAPVGARGFDAPLPAPVGARGFDAPLPTPVGPPPPSAGIPTPGSAPFPSPRRTPPPVPPSASAAAIPQMPGSALPAPTPPGGHRVSTSPGDGLEAEADRCPDCGRLLSRGTCLACGWKQPDKAAPRSAAAIRGSPAAAGAAPSTEKPQEFGGLRSDPGALSIAATQGGEREISLAKLGVVGGLGFAATLLLGGFLLFGGDGGAELPDMGPEEATQAVSAIEKMPANERTGRDWQTLALGLATLKRHDEALDAYLNAGKLNRLGSSGMGYVFAQLGDPFLRDRAVKVLVELPSTTGVDEELAMRLTDDSIIVRRQVLKVMKRRGSATVAHEVDVAVRDLLDAPTCAERKEGLATLARIASGQDRARALQAIGEVEEGPKNEQTSCMLPELERSKTRILKR